MTSAVVIDHPNHLGIKRPVHYLGLDSASPGVALMERYQGVSETDDSLLTKHSLEVVYVSKNEHQFKHFIIAALPKRTHNGTLVS